MSFVRICSFLDVSLSIISVLCNPSVTRLGSVPCREIMKIIPDSCALHVNVTTCENADILWQGGNDKLSQH